MTHDPLNDHWHDEAKALREEMAFPLLLAVIVFGGGFVLWFILTVLGI